MGFKFNPITGQLDMVGDSGSAGADNFSYEVVPFSSTVTIPVNQQMIVHDYLDVTGTLVADGTLVMIN